MLEMLAKGLEFLRKERMLLRKKREEDWASAQSSSNAFPVSRAFAECEMRRLCLNYFRADYSYGTM
jgi:hypothetical protein